MVLIDQSGELGELTIEMFRFSNFVKEDWNEYLHPRVPRGKKGGGQFSHKYIHYSDEPLNKLDDVPTKEQSENGPKPRGIWFSVGEDWVNWLKDSHFDMHPDFPWHKQTALVLKKKAKVLRISNAKQMDSFTKKYYGVDEYLPDINTPKWKPGQMINWQRVAQDYDGIIIAPYIGSRRLEPHTMWYYGWDVASGCVWNIDAIRMLK